MAILPLNLARVSNSLRSGLTQRNLTRTQQQLVEVQNQLATGKRLNAPSDSPADAAAAMQLRKTLEQQLAYATNLKHAGSQLSEVDSTLGDLTDLLRQAQGIASANASSIVSADERAAAATAINGIFTQAMSLANKQFQGTYLFAGDRGTQPPFVSDLGGIRFAGSENVLGNAYDQGASLPFMVNGNVLFGAMSSQVHGSADLTPALSGDTRLSDLRGAAGNGVSPGAFLLSNGATSALIDVSGADTVQDVIDAINGAGVGTITASLSGGGITLSGGAGETISVTQAGSSLPGDLGILTAAPLPAGTPLVGANALPRLTPFTPLATLRAGAGLDPAGLTITNGAKTASISFASATTVEDMLNAINTSGAGVLARISADGTGIDIVNATQGLAMTISENGGTTAAQLGVRSMSPETLLADLNGGKGVRTETGADFQITRRDGSTFQVDLSNLATVQDVIDAINAADGGGGLAASFNAAANGIRLDDTTAGAGTLRVEGLNFSQAAADLGLTGAAAGAALVGTDVNRIESNGLLSNLMKLHESLIHNDQAAITAAAEGIQADLDRVIRTRGQVGAQVQDFEARQNRLDEQSLALETMLSELEDVDYNEAITRFTLLQTALQANMQTTGQVLNLSLLDFLG